MGYNSVADNIGRSSFI